MGAAATPSYSSARRPSALREVWRFRQMLRRLIVRNLKVKYQRTVLGFVWTLLNPLLIAGILVTVFTHIVRIPLPSYWAFILSGYFTWNFAAQLLAAATTTLNEHAALRRSVAFPSEVLVLGAAASRLVEFVVELALALVVLSLAHHRGVPASYALLPVLVVLQVLVTTGLALIVATLATFYDDVQHVMPVLLLLLFYLSPVFYPMSMVPEAARWVFGLNPFAGLLTLFHAVLYEGRMPSGASLLIMTIASVAIYAAGHGIFNRYKPVFAEIV